MSRPAKYHKLEPRTLSRAMKDRILERDKYECQYCSFPAETVDHVEPFSWAFDDSEENLVASCFLCNMLASNKIFKSFKHKMEWLIERRYQHTRKNIIAIWTTREVEQLGRKLQNYIVNTAVVCNDDKERIYVAQKLLGDGWRVTTGNTWIDYEVRRNRSLAFSQ